jgi:putative SOS response-associated peptidase YedK
VVHYDDKERQRCLDLMRSGLIPNWAKDIKIGYSTINAMAETVETKPVFREAFARRRCLVPVDNFYEWQKIGKERQPYAIALADRGIMALAGLWETLAVGRRRDGAQLCGHHDRAERAMRADL